MTKLQIPDTVFKKQPVTTSAVSNIFGVNARGRWISVMEGGNLAYYYATETTIKINSNYSIAGAKSKDKLFTFNVNLWKRLITVGNNMYLSAYRFIPRYINSAVTSGNVVATDKIVTTRSETWNISGEFKKQYVMMRFDGGVQGVDTSITLQRGRDVLSPKPTAATLKTVYSYNNIQIIPNESTQNWLTGDPSYLQDYVNTISFVNQAAAEESGRTGGRSSAPPGPRAPRNPNATPAIFRPTPAPAPIRVEFGPALEFGPSMASVEGKPYILQRYIINVGELPQQITRRFWIKLVPNSFQYSDVSSSWSEVDRPGNYAITAWSKYKPLKVSFRFLIAGTVDPARLRDQASEIPLDGLLTSVEQELRDLRAISTAPHPISLVNFQPYLTDTMRYPFLRDKTGAKFVISDMGVTASRFTDNGISNASAAEINISLIEYIEPVMELAVLPPIRPQGTPPTDTPDDTPQDISKNLFTSTFTVPR
jgi:hypothetical protein